jgi:hypothetical protein
VSRDYAALFVVIEQRAARPFAWRRGRDCVSFAAACVKAQTDHNPLAGIPRWSSRREALAFTRERGGLIEAIDIRFDRVPPALAQRGDIAGLPDPLFGVRLMIVEGDTLVGPGERGLERLPRGAMTIAWSATRRGNE